LVHHPVSVDELRGSAFATNQIMHMPRRTAYPCSDAEFGAAIDLIQKHGPTTLPARPGEEFSSWWNTV
jgi:hypothetical protein